MSLNSEIIHLHIGQAGVQIGNACWELYCLEHGVLADGTACKYNPINSVFAPTATTTTTNCNRAVPRAVLIDLDSTPIDEIRQSAYGRLFPVSSLITGREDAASNFGRGYGTVGAPLIERGLERIRQIAEDSERLQGLILFRSIGGGTGSGYGTSLLEELTDAYGKTIRMEFVVFPSPRISPVLVEPYNAILATHMCMPLSDCSILVDNEAIYEICTNNLHVTRPTYTNLNRVLAQCTASTTASTRFNDGHMDLATLQTNLVPFPRIHFPIIAYAPLIAATNYSHEPCSVQQITNACFHSLQSRLIKCVDTTNRHNDGTYVSCCLLYRGNVRPSDVNASIRTIQEQKQMAVAFVQWSPTPFKIAICQNPPRAMPNSDIGVHRTNAMALCMLANNSAIRHACQTVANNFDTLLSKRTFLHHYTENGVEEALFIDAQQNIKALIDDYINVETG